VPFKTRTGVPLQVVISVPGGCSGLGLSAQANLSPEATFVAVTVTSLLGMGPSTPPSSLARYARHDNTGETYARLETGAETRGDNDANCQTRDDRCVRCGTAGWVSEHTQRSGASVRGPGATHSPAFQGRHSSQAPRVW